MEMIGAGTSGTMLEAPRQWSLPMVEASQVFEARHRASQMAREIGFSETKAGAVALVVTEAGNNLVKHAQGGEMIVGPLRDGRRGIEVLAVDRGPGMRDVGRCLRDGYSTTGTTGTGFGAIRRLSDAFDVHTAEGRGTVVLAQILADDRAETVDAAPLEVGAVCLPIRGEQQPGDGWSVVATPAWTRLLVADGIGHGPEAAKASEAAVTSLRSGSHLSVGALVESMHGTLRPTRGAVVAVAEIRPSADLLVYAGIGNIAGAIWTPAGSQSLVSMNGTIGHAAARAREFSYRWPADAVLILHSDGLGTRWNLGEYAGIGSRHPSVVAALLYRDFKRGRDDVTVLVARRRGRP
jgi:anti-sigma regulatory factor (Ser/Thr protein kinase)